MNNLRTYKCLGVDESNNCDQMPEATKDTTCYLASKLSLIIFIGLCGPVELLLVHSNVTQSVGLSVDCPYTHSFLGPPHMHTY